MSIQMALDGIQPGISESGLEPVAPSLCVGVEGAVRTTVAK